MISLKNGFLRDQTVYNGTFLSFEGQEYRVIHFTAGVADCKSVGQA